MMRPRLPLIGTCSVCGYLGYLVELPRERWRRVFICDECRMEQSEQPMLSLAPLPPLVPLPPIVAPEALPVAPAPPPERRPPGREIGEPLPARRQARKAGA
jgi:hypothetical protein